jgi:hypothetical protein
MPEPSPTIPPVPAGWLLGALLGAGALGVIAGSLGPQGSVSAATIAAGVVVGAGVLAIITLRSTVALPQANIATGFLAFSFVRLFGSLAGAVVVVALLDPERRAFVNGFLAAAFAALVLETMILRRWSALEPGAKGVAP